VKNLSFDGAGRLGFVLTASLALSQIDCLTTTGAGPVSAARVVSRWAWMLPSSRSVFDVVVEWEETVSRALTMSFVMSLSSPVDHLRSVVSLRAQF
jgi:hypothetical protein